MRTIKLLALALGISFLGASLSACRGNGCGCESKCNPCGCEKPCGCQAPAPCGCR